MIDFHTHTLFSDGVLNPSELVRRAHIMGYRAIGLADHVDGSNLDFVVPRIVKVAADLNRFQDVLVIPGAEITHAPPGQIPGLVSEARSLGAVLVIIHGESPVEPVAPGTNRAGIESGADILAHPGFVTPEEVKSAAKNGICLEITSRNGHSLTNGHVGRLAVENGATLVSDTDTHTPDNLITRDRALQVLVGAGLTDEQALETLGNNERLLEKLLARMKEGISGR